MKKSLQVLILLSVVAGFSSPAHAFVGAGDDILNTLYFIPIWTVERVKDIGSGAVVEVQEFVTPGDKEMILPSRQGPGYLLRLATPLSEIFREDPSGTNEFIDAVEDTVIDAIDIIDTLDIGSNLLKSVGMWTGDANFDGSVDFADFSILSANYGMTGATWFDGDFDLDGTVGFSDFLLLSENY